MKPKNILLSVKPKYTDLIVNGEKTIELRKKFPQDLVGGTIILYASSPLKKAVASVTIENISLDLTEEIWRKYGKSSQVTRSFFDRYYQDSTKGFAISLSNPSKFANPITMHELKSKYQIFPPQSYRYLTREIVNDIKRYGFLKSVIADTSQSPRPRSSP